MPVPNLLARNEGGWVQFPGPRRPGSLPWFANRPVSKPFLDSVVISCEKERVPVADKVNKVTIIGSGPAGYTAAIYAARANLAPVVFAGGPAEEDPQRVPGGQLMITNDVENYPGFPESITGPDLIERFKKQAERFGTEVYLENVVKVDFSRRPFHIQGESRQCHSETVIISTGASAMWLGVKGEDDS